ncbi:MAG: SpoIIE family protein phosphatase [Clostridia bacterium]|nr:SpoIIE family protein phosphatase [Clostridia bacterium]
MGVINKKSVFYSLYIFLAARAGVAGIAPFGPAAFAIAVMSHDMSYGFIGIILYSFACIIGSLTTGVWQQTVISTVTIILFIFAYYFIKNSIQQEYPFVLKCAVALVFTITVPMIILLSSTNSTIMDVINLAIQAAVTFIMFFVYRIGESAISDIVDKNTTSYKPTQEELACFAIMAIIAFLGLPSLTIFGLSIRNVISIFVIMAFSIKGGMGTGAAAGIMIGILTNSSSAIIISLFSFCGFLAGLLNKFKKAGVIIAFAVGNVLLATMLGASKEIIYAMYETGFASILFALMPLNLYDFIKIPVIEEYSFNKKQQYQKNDLPVRFDYAGKIRNTAVKKAKFYSDTLTEMSSEFMDIAGNENLLSANECKNEDSCLIRVYNKVCSDCKLSSNCWKREYKIREKALKQCEKIIEKKGSNTSEIMRILSEFCVKPDAVTDELKIGIEIRRIEKICNAKIEECRSMVIRQFGEMGRISHTIAEEIKRATNYDFKLENSIIDALKRHEVHAYDVVVTKNYNNMPEVTIYIRKSCDKETISKITDVVSQETGSRMNVYSVGGSSKRNGVKELKLIVKPELNISPGFASVPAESNTVSGDSYSYVEIADGRAFAILSDGMGTGSTAATQSESVIKILELYIKSGIEISAAVSTVNMMLTTKNSEVLTSSVDVCCINRHSKIAGFVKMGAVPSVIIGKDNVRAVEINRPPAGVSAELEEASCKITECDVSDDIAIVMFTDGVYDAFSNGGVNKRVFFEYIATIVRRNSKDNNGAELVAKEIINKTQSFSSNADDMSVIVLYLY